LTEKSRLNFENFLRDARDEISSMREFYAVLNGKLDSGINTMDFQEWLTDSFADKVFSSYAKLKQIFSQLPNTNHRNLEVYVNALTDELVKMSQFAGASADARTIFLPKITDYLHSLTGEVEFNFVRARKGLYEQGWEVLSSIKPIKPLDTERKKYVSARENLGKARENLAEGRVEDVTMPLRSAIDLSIKERFGFSKIHPMRTFFVDANKYDFPLSSYDLIYGLFDEGSSRIHEGKGSTVFEAKQMIRMVSEFIDSLDMINIPQEKIDEFKSKSNAVE